jgi:hypothetical protein
MAEAYQFVHQPGDHTFSAAVELRRDTFRERTSCAMRILYPSAPKTERKAQTTTPDRRYDTARRVHSGRALRATLRSANHSSRLSII